MSGSSVGSSSLPLSQSSIGERLSPAILEHTSAVHEQQAAALTGLHEQQMEVAQSTVRLDNKIEKVHNNMKKLVDHINRNDARSRARLNRHDGLLEDTNGRVAQHDQLHEEAYRRINQHDGLHEEANRKVEQHAQNLEEHGGRLESLENGHQWWIPAAWAVGTTAVCGLLVWGITTLLGKEKKTPRRREPEESSDEETDVEDSGVPVGRKRPVGNRPRGRRPHPRAWRVAPELRSEWG
jgi:hypothetical protein